MQQSNAAGAVWIVFNCCNLGFELVVVALEVDDVDEMHMRVVNAGFRAKSAPLDLGIHKTCYVHGPDDEIIELLEDRSDREMMARITRRTLAAREARGSSSGAKNNSDQSELKREQVIK